MKSIAAKMVAVTIALGASSAACAAVNLHGEAGAEFTNLSASFGAGEPGMTFSSQWAHSDNDGDSVGLGMGYNFNVGPFLMTLGGKAVYLNPKDGDEGYAIAAVRENHRLTIASLYIINMPLFIINELHLPEKLAGLMMGTAGPRRGRRTFSAPCMDACCQRSSPGSDTASPSHRRGRQGHVSYIAHLPASRGPYPAQPPDPACSAPAPFRL